MPSVNTYTNANEHKQSRWISISLMVIGLLMLISLAVPFIQLPMLFVGGILAIISGWILRQAVNVNEGKQAWGVNNMDKKQNKKEEDVQSNENLPIACRNCGGEMKDIKDESLKKNERRLICQKCGRDVVVDKLNLRHLIKQNYEGDDNLKKQATNILKRVGENAQHMKLVDDEPNIKSNTGLTD